MVRESSSHSFVKGAKFKGRISMSQFATKLRTHAEAEFGASNRVAIENWLGYWSSTVERNQSILQFFRSKLNLNLKGKRILDVGCGTAGLSELVTGGRSLLWQCDFFEKILDFGQAFTADLPAARGLRYCAAQLSSCRFLTAP
jgi:hypothetical protein